MSRQAFYPHLSVDCVLIGFDEEGLKVLLVEKTHVAPGHTGAISKLPGDLIYEEEELDAAARRIPFDHRDIIDLALERIRSSVKKEPALIYDMLPAKFTALQLRRLNEEIHGKPMDVRNFHKKIASRPYIVPLDEKEEGVAHRAARYYRFDRKIYNRLYYRS